MSLSKRYALRCDSSDVQMRRELKDNPKADLDATRPERRELRRECRYYSEEEFNSKAARATARKAGWVRYGEAFPLYRGAGPQDTSKLMFDICPGCAPKICPDHIPAAK